MEVRNIKTGDDLDLIARVYTDSFRNTYRDYLMPEVIEDGFESIDDLRDFFILIDDNGEIIGVSSVFENEITHLYLRLDSVDRGYGNMLLKAMVHELIERGYDEIVLWDLKENERASAFYRKNGFELTLETRPFIYGKAGLLEGLYKLEVTDK